jgi:hypothetical protein
MREAEAERQENYKLKRTAELKRLHALLDGEESASPSPTASALAPTAPR